MSDQWTELHRIATAARPLWNRAGSPSHEEADALRAFNEKATPQTIGDLLDKFAALERCIYENAREIVSVRFAWDQTRSALTEVQTERDALKADKLSAHSKIEGMIECHGQLHRARPEGIQCICEEML